MGNDAELEEYEVGYRKPPKSGQFLNGISGNPAGRPKRSPDFHSELVRQLYSKVAIQEQGKRRLLMKYEVMARQLVNRAMSGGSRELDLVLALLPDALEKVAHLRRKYSARDLSDDQIADILLRHEDERAKAEVKKAKTEAEKAALNAVVDVKLGKRNREKRE